jgi:hypothetical protein
MILPEILGRLTEEQVGKLMGQLKEIEGCLDFSVNLKPIERKTIHKLGDRARPFVHKAMEIASGNPDLVPHYLSTEELQRDYELAQNLFSLLSQLMKIKEKMEDTWIVAGARVLDWSRKFYKYLKDAAKAGVPGTDNFVGELSGMYHRRPQKKNKTETENSPAP